MLSYKKERERAEEEALMLRNRIQMLMLENQRTHQKINETRRQTKEFIEIKLISQRHSMLLQEVIVARSIPLYNWAQAKEERTKHEQAQNAKNKQLKDNHLKNKYESQVRCYETAKGKADEVRNQLTVCSSVLLKKVKL